MWYTCHKIQKKNNKTKGSGINDTRWYSRTCSWHALGSWSAYFLCWGTIIVSPNFTSFTQDHKKIPKYLKTPQFYIWLTVYLVTKISFYSENKRTRPICAHQARVYVGFTSARITTIVDTGDVATGTCFLTFCCTGTHVNCNQFYNLV